MTESRTQGLFAELLEGARALEERPALEAKIADAQSARDYAMATAKFAEERYAALAADYDRIKAELATKEAELAQATFREKEAGDKLEVLVDAFKSVSRKVNESVELVAPEPKPELESMPAPTPVADTSTTSTTAGEVSTDLPGTYPWNKPEVTEVAVTSNPDPISVASTDTGMPSTVDTSASKPHADKPYWFKPDSLTWREWIDGGGERAPWLKDGDNLDLRY